MERIASITLEGDVPANPQVAHERSVALADLLHENHFALAEEPCGPYDVLLLREENRLVFSVTGQDQAQPQRISLAIAPLKSTIRDYFLICESYYTALKEAKPHKLEAIDMGRRGVHNDGAEALRTLLEGKIDVDFATARRLFTLVCVLHMK